MKTELKLKLIDYLSNFVTERKRSLIDQTLMERTRHVCTVLENIYQPHNASAVIRSCECFGIQDIHIIEKEHAYRVNPDIVLGASKWINLKKYCHTDENNVATCLTDLKNDGYQIVATTLRDDSISIHELDLRQKIALCFGGEKPGLSEEVHAMADVWLTIPMWGFTQSLNISVCAAICLFHLTHRLRNSDIDWHLTSDETIDLQIEWLTKTASHGDAIVRHFLQQLCPPPPGGALPPATYHRERE